MSYWQEKGWIHPDDPRGWFQWYCRYFMGRRHEDDSRQIERWRNMRRHVSRLKRNCMRGDLRCRPRPGVSRRAAFDTDGSWQTVNLPLGNFVAVARGRPVAGSASILSGTVCGVGFLLADKQPGRFGLEIAAIEFLFEANAS